MLVVVNNVVGWGWFPWLTPAFEDVLPILNVALGVNIAVYIVYMFNDEAWLKAITQILVNILAIVVLVAMLVVYPFDFSAHDFPVEISAFDLSWDLVARFVIGFAIFGTAIAVVTEIMKLVRALDRP